MIAPKNQGGKPIMEQRKTNLASMRVLVPKEVYNKFRIYVIKNNSSVSEMVRNYIESVTSNETIHHT
jgi:hypothetical protein